MQRLAGAARSGARLGCWLFRQLGDVRDVLAELGGVDVRAAVAAVVAVAVRNGAVVRPVVAKELVIALVAEELVVAGCPSRGSDSGVVVADHERIVSGAGVDLVVARVAADFEAAAVGDDEELVAGAAVDD